MNNYLLRAVLFWRGVLFLMYVFLGAASIFVIFAPQAAQAAFDDPAEYRITSYDYIPALDLFLLNGIPDIRHLDVVTLQYDKDSNMDIVTPPEVSDAVANLYFVTDGSRNFEYQFYDDSWYIPPAPYVWTKAGTYEVDITGKVGTATTRTHLATMRFTVTIDGGPLPTCSLSATPSSISAKNGETALLEWSSTGADTAVFNEGIGAVATSGSLTVSPSATTTYTGTFTGPHGSVTCSATVDVPDPVVLSLHEKAAALAKQVVNQPAYLWGGKGWDYDLAEFTSPERILSGYTYFNPDTKSKATGIGLDCSGLITWAFNRSYDLGAGFANNFVKYINADGMFREYQSDPIEEAELQPGDTLSFDWNSDGRMDHVAMYVGESGGYDVVDATSPDVGIRERVNFVFKQTPGFVGYRRIHQADAPLMIKTGSPVDLKVTDPVGNVLSASTVLASEEEYIREVPGELYYLELEDGHDGRSADMIISPHIRDGVYSIEVIPEPNADPLATYSLSVLIDGIETVVVSNEPVSSIPAAGFTLTVTDGAAESLEPTVKVLLTELEVTISNLTISSESRKRNLLATVDSARSWFDRARTDQVVRKLTKIQNDVNRHLLDELAADEVATLNQQINELLILLEV